eukprot:TRINITY_DN2284_c0_g1_i1.p1 TRINITY_DN2284_c0_g1~~TRINITY_DN2284_c0_g1_i1.p1  ORF type:complete len:225 (+),score=51.43 TRINITY_DN2284_c0_g1_i1:128-802(+)
MLARKLLSPIFSPLNSGITASNRLTLLNFEVCSQRRWFARKSFAGDLKKGQIIDIKGKYMEVMNRTQMSKQQRSAHVTLELVDVVTKNKYTERLRPQDAVELVDVDDEKYVFKGKSDDGKYLFEHEKTGEEAELTEKELGDEKTRDYLAEDVECQVIKLNDKVLSVQLPHHLEVRVKEVQARTEGTGRAMLENGRWITKVPHYVKEGEIIKVRVEDDTYMSRAD